MACDHLTGPFCGAHAPHTLASSTPVWQPVRGSLCERATVRIVGARGGGSVALGRGRPALQAEHDQFQGVD
ncbi:MAG: hypothetical protein ACTSRL_22910 [Candidatus Helarchaeota archaeon]